MTEFCDWHWWEAIEGDDPQPPELRWLSERWAMLSPCQRECARLIAAGHNQQSAAHEMGIAVTTLKNHMQAIFRKLGVSNRQELSLLVKWLMPDAVSVTRDLVKVCQGRVSNDPSLVGLNGGYQWR